MLKKIAALILVLSFSFLVSTGFAAAKTKSAPIGESIVKVGEDVTVPSGTAIKSVVAVGGSVTVFGDVLKDVVSVGGTIHLKDTSVIGGDVVAVGGKIVKDSGAITSGDIIEVPIPSITPLASFFMTDGMYKGIMIFNSLSLIGFMVLAIILVAFFTPQLGIVSSLLEKKLVKNFFIGLLLLILFIPLILVLLVSLIGICLIPVLIILYAAAGLFGCFAISHLLGKKALNAFRLYGRSMLAETLTGVILLTLLELIPYIGLPIKLIVVTCGLGAVYQTRFGTRS